MSADPRRIEPTYATVAENGSGASRLIRHDVTAWGVTIGELCSLFDLTPRAVRFYEERGLVTTTRDRQNKRIFDRRARRRLQFIADLRRAGLPLDTIRDLLDEADDDEVRLNRQALAKLAERLEALDATRADVARTVARLALDAAENQVSRYPRR